MIAIFTQHDGLTTAQLPAELLAWLERKAAARRAQLGGFPHTPADILVELVIAAVASDPDSEPIPPAAR
jgi:hypothetical protein